MIRLLTDDRVDSSSKFCVDAVFHSDFLLADGTFELSFVPVFLNDSSVSIFRYKVATGKQYRNFCAGMHFFGNRT